MKIRFIIIFVSVLMAFNYAVSLADDPIPTPDPPHYGGISCLVNGSTAPAGVIYQAFDNSGVYCGADDPAADTYFTAGKYSMPVYGDDPYSVSVDEGCDLLEHIVFKINGIVATELGPANDVWDGKGPIKIMNLSIVQTFSMTLTGPIEGKDEPGQTVSYSVKLKNNGTGIDSISLNGSNVLGWSITGLNPDGDYLDPNEEVTYEIQVHIPLSATIGQQDTLTLTAASIFDGSANTTFKIVTIADKTTGVEDGNFTVPGVFELFQNYPNPFNPETVIAFNLEKSGDVTLAVFDILGRKIATLQSGYLSSGHHRFRWYGTTDDGFHAASGVYFYRLSSAEFTLTRKMALLK